MKHETHLADEASWRALVGLLRLDSDPAHWQAARALAAQRGTYAELILNAHYELLYAEALGTAPVVQVKTHKPIKNPTQERAIERRADLAHLLESIMTPGEPISTSALIENTGNAKRPANVTEALQILLLQQKVEKLPWYFGSTHGWKRLA